MSLFTQPLTSTDQQNAELAQMVALAFRASQEGQRGRIQRIEYHPAQIQILSEARRYNVPCMGRRWGKTWFISDLAIETLLSGYPVCYCAPSYKNMGEVWREIIEALAPMKPDVSVQERRIGIGRGVMDFWSLDTDAADKVRGRKYKRVLIDEAAMIVNLLSVWGKVLRPTMIQYPDADAWFPSTPRGYNEYWKLWSRGQDFAKYPNWMSWQMPTSTNPYIPAGEIEEARNDSTEAEFRQEYEASFEDDGANAFRKVHECVIAVPQDRALPFHDYVIGCDWARVNDFTVFTVIDATLGHVVFIERFNNVDYTTQITRLQALCARFRPIIVVSEVNSNIALTEVLRRTEYDNDGKKVTIPIHEFQTTWASKNEIVQALALAFEHHTIGLIDHPVLLSELQAFQPTRLEGGNLRYAAATGHDDTVMSLAMAWWRAKDLPRLERLTGDESLRRQLAQMGWKPENKPSVPDEAAYWEMSLAFEAERLRRKQAEPHSWEPGLVGDPHYVQ